MLDKIEPQLINVKTSKIISQIQENILNKLFGSEYVNVKTLLQTTSQIVCNDAQGYEFELRLSDENGHTSKQTWINFDNQFGDVITMQSFDDDIIYSYESSIPLNNIHFRSYQKSNIYERKILINMIVSRSECKNIIPMNIKLSKETLMSPAKHLEKYINIQRRQRCSYTFNDPALSDWRIDKTIRFFSNNVQDKKMTIDIGVDNFQYLKYYDYLDIEFEFVGEFSNLFNSFFNLIEKIYKPFEDFNIIYNIIKYVVNLKYPSSNLMLQLIPTPTILTNNMLRSLKIRDFSFSFKLVGEHTIIAIFGNLENVTVNESTVDIYAITESEINHIYGNLNFMKKKEDTKGKNKIYNRLRSFVTNDQSDQLPPLTLFEAEYSKGTYVLLDTLFYCSNSIENQPLINRMEYINKFVLIQNKFINSCFITNFIFNPNDISWNYLINHIENNKIEDKALNHITNKFQTDGIICKPNKSPLFSSKIYKIKNDKSSTIDFKICYVPSKKVFYLYVIGNTDQIIKNKSLTNKFSIDHFGYSLLSSIGTSNGKDVYILYVSPFMKNSFMFKPRLNWCQDNLNQETINSINKLMDSIYRNPLKYNGSIMKMVKVKDGWVPISNKGFNSQPNTYLESLKIGSLIYDNLKDESCQELPSETCSVIKESRIISPTICKLLKAIYSLLDQYIIEKYFNKEKFENVLDVFDENNININLLYNVGLVKRVFAVNDKKYVLSSYVESSVKKDFNESPFIEGIKTRINDNNFDLSIVHSSLTKENIIKKLNKQRNYIPRSIDVIYIQSRLDEIKSCIDLINIRILCEKVLSPNGKIIFKIFDGDKIIDFLENKDNTPNRYEQTGRKNKKIVNKSLGIAYVCDNTFEVNETDDEYIIPNPESIKMVNSDETNDEYQYEYTEIEHFEQPAKSHMKITINKTQSDQMIQIKYDTDLICVQKPNQYLNVDINNLGLICYYYYKFNRYDENGKFKSTKQLSKIQTKNLRSLLGINTELFGNIYDRTLDNWYSIHHNVDKLFGSKEYSQSAIIDGINDGVLIEKEYLDEDVISFINQRRNSKFSTVIVTKTNLNNPELYSGHNKSLSNILFEIPVTGGYKLYTIFPNFITNEDIILIKNYLMRIIDINPSEEIFKYYLSPKINDNVYCKKLIFKKEFFSFIFESFKLYDICVPLTQVEVATFISANRKFSQMETVENFLNTLTAFCMERI